MTLIIDYGVGNLFSLVSSLKRIGAEAVVTADPDTIRRADKLILPGVGAFADAAEKLRRSGMDVRPWASPLWASAWVCKCCSKKAMNSGSIRGWGCSKAASFPWRGPSPPG